MRRFFIRSACALTAFLSLTLTACGEKGADNSSKSLIYIPPESSVVSIESEYGFSAGAESSKVESSSVVSSVVSTVESETSVESSEPPVESNEAPAESDKPPFEVSLTAMESSNPDISSEVSEQASPPAAEESSEDTTAPEQGNTVYIAGSGKGKKYHSSPDCSNMKSPKAIDKSEAEDLGYTPCKKCW